MGVSADKVGKDGRLFFRKAELLFSKLNAFNEESHVPSKGAHGLESFQILSGLLSPSAVDQVPVLAGNDRHTGNGEIFVQLVKGGRIARPAAADNRCAHLHGFVNMAAEKTDGPGKKSVCRWQKHSIRENR